MSRPNCKISLKCEYCKSEYQLPKSKAENSKFCSKACKDNSTKSERVECVCKVCNQTFFARNKQEYCSKEHYYDDVKLKRILLKCSFCNKDYEKPCNRLTKFCSKKCQAHALSGGLQVTPSNGRAGFRKDLPNTYFFKSSLEADYARWCDAIGKKYIYEYKTFIVQYEGSDKVYTPDFYHPDEDKYIETKAIRRDKKYSGNILAADILKQQGINIDVLLMSDFYRNIKQSGHYWSIENIENRNYAGTKHLIYIKK